jgi:hypothetical protein
MSSFMLLLLRVDVFNTTELPSSCQFTFPKKKVDLP